MNLFVGLLIQNFDLERVLSVFLIEVKEFKELQTDFTRFRTMFNYNILVQMIITVEDLRNLGIFI